ncbi:MAG TPA: FIST N-terminal domain-containing protein [Candidatus Thermoplasmatota archaeon]|nr:FIST N-terminal domain-containing protein [Candidatus Thermoplasmatota archaeon]
MKRRRPSFPLPLRSCAGHSEGPSKAAGRASHGGDVGKDLAAYVAAGASVVWDKTAFGTRVAAVRIGPPPLLLLLAGHRPSPSILPGFQVDDLKAEVMRLGKAGWTVEGETFEVPNGPCRRVKDPSGNELTLLQETRPTHSGPNLDYNVARKGDKGGPPNQFDRLQMEIEQRIWRPQGQRQGSQAGWGGAPRLRAAHLVLIFGEKDALSHPSRLADLRRDYPDAHFCGGSTAGEIAGAHVMDGTIVATAVRFDATRVCEAAVDLRPDEDSRQAGGRLAQALAKDGLAHVFVISDGQHVNGSELVRGMMAQLPAGVAVTGGLAGDGSHFRSTLTVADGGADDNRVVAIGLYGKGLRVGYGSLGGWDPFGPQRIITRSKGNVLYELDGQPALALYKKYLGEHAAGLPATGLLFPLSVRTEGGVDLTRTILAVDESDQSLTFAGDMPQGSMARLMKANFDRLVDGAHGAAQGAALARPAELAILISCIGRKLVLKQRVEEELEAVQDVLGRQATMAGFYSYGEICPSSPNASCELHNQTMTITTLSER